MHRVPHRFPFEWIDDCAPGRAKLLLTATGPFCRNGSFPVFLAVEILAQASLAALTGGNQTSETEEPSGQGLLAGIDTIRFLDPLVSHPLGPGDLLEVEAEQTAAFGRLIKVQGTLRRDAVELLEGALLLASP